MAYAGTMNCATVCRVTNQEIEMAKKGVNPFAKMKDNPKEEMKGKKPDMKKKKAKKKGGY